MRIDNVPCQAERDAVADETALASHYSDDAAKLLERASETFEYGNGLTAMIEERRQLSKLREFRRQHAARLRARSKFFS